MNQKRNLLFNILFNVVFVSILVYFNFTITSDNPIIWKFILVTIMEMAVLSIFVAIIQSETLVFFIIPPTGLFTLPYLFIEYLKGKVKWIKSEYGSYIARYDDDRIKIYKFNLLSYAMVEDIPFNGSEKSIKSVHKYFQSIENERIAVVERHKERLEKNNVFKEWDGTVDSKTKRINTINKIIK